jgi:hypothetical protein
MMAKFHPASEPPARFAFFAPGHDRERLGLSPLGALRLKLDRDPLRVMLGQPCGCRVAQAGGAFGSGTDEAAVWHAWLL